MTNTKTDVRSRVFNWASEIGKPEALKRLVERRVPIHTADKLIGGRYPSEPGSLLSAACEMAMDIGSPKSDTAAS